MDVNSEVMSHEYKMEEVRKKNIEDKKGRKQE